ncbi:MAG: shikimate kinase [Spirochaetia bacterium]|nr:shikimate kinase [Spirochaetia bacterium]
MKSYPERPFSGPLPVKLALLGFMGCGKSSIGPLLAKLLGLSYIDLDELIERRESMSISEIFQHRGEAAFRELERSMLAETAQSPEACVLSCGGGIILSDQNRAMLRKDFVSVWIDVPLEELLKRLELERAARPLLVSEDYRSRAAALFAQRLALYELAARYRYGWKKGDDAAASAEGIAGMLRT